ncbi:3-[(3aS,4S,7aS)-7a-methyl-1,5-dioxo-octahydro-1H-inden-4-yl]propanoyl:CoA ligase [Streptomyces umbrinus]|uniref:FadD3 family acyl-CoA ligase n=1 Tax=Streptomyces umbrinus TaxID=67370 RepID=UPI0016735930|nr:FadD3 family acyl-CoA ligase [Streptomyces umbrinus]GHB59876.1 3-[(3aS,4S,7aS)-7a-methyl-1,5-dioxo-octahydro-1H-inden-4-yl]propanoyl:CoA ligase [Streptomyces umbrinus]
MRYDQEYLSIPNAVRCAAERFGDAPAVVDGRIRWSFGELGRQMTQAVRAVLALGIGPGDRVGICAPNSAEWIVAALGVQGAGGIVVPLNTRFKAAELAYILRKSGARALLASPFLGTDYVAELRKHDPELPALRTSVSILGPLGEADLAWPDFLARGAAVTEGAAHASIDRVTPQDVSDVMFTSGTTGHPKGVVLTHEQSLRAYGWMAREYTFRPSDTFLVIPPFFHCFGYKAGWLASFLHGVTVIPMPLFDAGRALEIIDRDKVSILLGPPTIFQDLIDLPGRSRYDTSSLRVSMTGGTTIPEQLIHAMKDELSFDVVMSAYGLTESTALATTTRLGDGPETVARTTGRPVPDVEVRTVDDQGRVLPAGEAGEIQVRGYNVTRGYWEEPEATAAAISADGWLRTGDVGVLDADGNLSIVDRKKDMYIVGGFNAYPAEIERLLLGCPSVAEAAVIGVPDERLGEVGCAYVVPRPDQQVSEADVVAWSRANMANFKVPRHVRFVDGLPRNASRKVLKDELRTWFGEGV